MERAPQELFPIIPPSVARLLVAVSGPRRNPCGRPARLRSSCTTPGCPGRVGAAPPGAIRNRAPRGGPREGPLAVHGTPQQLFLPGYNAVEEDFVPLL